MPRLLRVLALTSLFVGLCLLTPNGPAQAEEPVSFNYSDNGFPILDPAHASLYRINDERLLLGLFDCLTRLDPETGKAVPAAAESFSVGADGKTWTFKLRPGGVWSDGSPVTAQDFLRAWKRIIDPFTKSQWSALYRPIEGCAAIRDNDARANGYVELRNYLKELLASHPNGIPGKDLNATLDDTGIRPFLTSVKSRSVKRLLNWSDDEIFPPESAKKVMDTLKEERKEIRALWETPLDAFGKQGSGAYATDDHTLVVKTHGDVPYLPELLARSAFAPLHVTYESKRDLIFEFGAYTSNGPFILGGARAKPPEDSPGERVLSVAQLARNPAYNGPHAAKVDEVKCFTDQTKDIPVQEDIYQYERNKLHWVVATWPEYPKGDLRKKVEGLSGFTTRDTPRVLYLRFRCDRAPFDKKDARRAYAMALDRDLAAKQFWPAATPAYRLVPPGITGRLEGVECAKPNTASAVEAFKAAGLDSETWVEVSYGESPGQSDAVGAMRVGWKKVLGNEPAGTIQSDEDVRTIVRAGRYQAMLTDFRGALNDPAAYLAPLHSKDADSGLGWHDEAYDALVDAALDPDTALADPAAWLATVQVPSLQGALAAAKSSQAGRETLRREALKAAEQRILDEFVIVPVLFLREATLLRPGVTGLGTDEARRNPGFVGSLVSVGVPSSGG